MYACTLHQFAAMTNLSLPRGMDGTIRITGAAIDSRSVKPGYLFFALSGSREHGIRYAQAAMDAGAVGVVTDRAGGILAAETEAAVQCVLSCDDPIRVLQKLAAWNRQQSAALVCGVTGSVGKTTTRQMLACILNSEGRGIQSEANFNNELGVPLTLTRLTPEDEFAVLEMGAAREGDLTFLCDLARPEIAIVTRVAPCHLSSFGSLDAVQRAKQELPAAIPEHGTIFLNADDEAVRAMASASRGRVVLFGESADADVRVSRVSAENGICHFECDGVRYQFHGGRHLVTSAAAATAVALEVGVSTERIASGLSCFEPDSGRGRVVLRDPWIVIDETYNASPASVQACIDSLPQWRGRRLILVLGDMLELGDTAVEYHARIARQLERAGVSHTLFCGEFADVSAQAAVQAGVPMNRVSAFREKSTLLAMLECVLSRGDVVCVKGSRSTHMEDIVNWLKSVPGSERTAA